jgi:hypothetical protein
MLFEHFVPTNMLWIKIRVLYNLPLWQRIDERTRLHVTQLANIWQGKSCIVFHGVCHPQWYHELNSPTSFRFRIQTTFTRLRTKPELKDTHENRLELLPFYRRSSFWRYTSSLSIFPACFLFCFSLVWNKHFNNCCQQMKIDYTREILLPLMLNFDEIFIKVKLELSL